MYDKFLSTQWIFDRCIEGSNLVIPISFLLSVFFCFLLYKLLKISHLKHLFLYFFLIPVLIFNILGVLFSFVSVFILYADMGFIVVVSVAVLIKYFNLWNGNKIKVALSFIVTSLLFLPFVVFVYFLVGFFIINCNPSMQFFKAIQAAHEIHGKMKEQKLMYGYWPKDEEQLKQILPEEYLKVVSSAKSKYVYDSKSDSFVWFVRPSKYHLVIFDTEKEFTFYKFPGQFGFINPIQEYPPSYLGPWDQLPN